MTEFKLPGQISILLEARNQVRSYYEERLKIQGSDAKLKFTLDGNLVGDIGEAIAVELFGVKLVPGKSTEGIDGYSPDGRHTVQIKATGTGRGPAFRRTQTRADHLLFFELDFDRATGIVVYNGPERRALAYLPDVFQGQRSLTKNQIRAADSMVLDHERLNRTDC
ncbi:hypothetical protein HUO14_16095 [Parasphingorhabdus flavimaris]|uniref:DUF6998 domain-containing protein n=1 Tax=Parasphingorhabdus flavimaris TaxID=266812 RepID=A0ABX2N6S0_9SPHN|nr:hypothetical protein [Parasphingorhabdus flavimaris]NVD29420.1 hypothetical protein [Parasphingorhabdus flavimaris]